MESLLTTIVERGRAVLDKEHATRQEERDFGELAESLLSERGEASGVTIARNMLDIFEQSKDDEKLSILSQLVERFGSDSSMLNEAIEAYRKDPNDEQAMRLHTAAEPRRQELIRRLNLAPNGTKTLVAMRTFLLAHLKAQPEFRALDSDFHHLLSSWFNRGFLVMRRIDWSTPAVILEKIIRYEAVHAIDDWDDLRRRIDSPDRRCYGFFHPALTDEPLIFVEVALSIGIPDAIAPILTADRVPVSVEEANTAVFYSISNCQAGLKGVSFGNFLIKQVVQDLHRDLPHLDTFVTLSPVPGLMRWLKKERELEGVFDEETKTDLEVLDQADWHLNKESRDRLRTRMMGVARYYFLNAKMHGMPVDPVARFHLGNGARLERINWLGDTSPKGLKQAAGFMVNYLYHIPDIEKNHEAYVTSNEVIVSQAVKKLEKID